MITNNCDSQFEKLCTTPYYFLGAHENELGKRGAGSMKGMRTCESERLWLKDCSGLWVRASRSCLTLLSCLVSNGLMCLLILHVWVSLLSQMEVVLSPRCMLCCGQALPGAATRKCRHIPDFLLTCAMTTASCWRPYFILNHCLVILPGSCHILHPGEKGKYAQNHLFPPRLEGLTTFFSRHTTLWHWARVRSVPLTCGTSVISARCQSAGRQPGTIYNKSHRIFPTDQLSIFSNVNNMGNQIANMISLHALPGYL